MTTRRKLEIGDTVLAFDALAWMPIGDVGDNSCFWVPAKVLNIYTWKGRELARLQFENGRESSGYFTSGLYPRDERSKLISKAA